MNEPIGTIQSIVDTDEGYIIKTSGDEVRLYMNMDQYCCETPGYFMSEDDLDQFIGTTLIRVEVTDEALNTVEVPDFYDGGVMFVNIHTDKGLLQFVAYNEHNGYYSHLAKVTVGETVIEENYL